MKKGFVYLIGAFILASVGFWSIDRMFMRKGPSVFPFEQPHISIIAPPGYEIGWAHGTPDTPGLPTRFYDQIEITSSSYLDSLLTYTPLFICIRKQRQP